jgi:MerR family transcriptional regulator, redox-sensitive transcriptional activator SoxR
MPGLPIGQVARLAGVRASAVRYYELAGLLPRPAREYGQRRYGPEATARLRIIRIAREAGFTIAETRTFLSGFTAATPPAQRWRALAQRKLAEIEAQSARLERMRALLNSSFHCGCLRIEDCERALLSACAPARQSGK